MTYLMNLDFNFIVKPVALMLLLGLISSPVLSQNTPQFDRLKQQFQNGKVFSADFMHIYQDSFTGEEQTHRGKIWIGKNQYKLQGSNQVMLVDGETSIVYDETKNRVMISEYIQEEDDFAPSAMLQGVDSTFTVTESTISDTETVIQLTTDDLFSVFQSITIRLNNNGLPAEIVAEDQADNRLTTLFTNGQFLQAGKNLFEISYPDNAEQIDLRHNPR